MTFRKLLVLALASSSAVLVSSSALAWDRPQASTFAQLPAGRTNPEGIALDRATGDVYVADFEVTGSPPGHVVVFDAKGKFLRDLVVQGSSSLLLGLAFHPTTHDLLVIDFGNGEVLDVNPQTGAATPFSVIGPGSGLNGLTFDGAGFVYVSDSFQGTIWRIPPSGGAASVWKTDPLLTTTGVPPFGANGLAFDNAQTFLFVANTGNDSIVRIANAGATGGTIDVLTSGINGADGLAIDENDDIWVCANQSDEIVVVDPTGKAIAKLGDFEGIKSGMPRGLLFPASLVFDGDSVLVTNLALDTRLFGFNTVDAQWTAQVTTYTVARLPRRIPKQP
jgi:sugar lactone lactonase YvrE